MSRKFVCDYFVASMNQTRSRDTQQISEKTIRKWKFHSNSNDIIAQFVQIKEEKSARKCCFTH